MEGKFVSVEVCIHGKPVREYSHPGTTWVDVCVHGKPVREYSHQGATWIEGRKGSEFTLRFRNRHGGRVLLVPSVDGLNIVDGKKCSFGSDGYILPAFQSLDVPGWRLNTSEVAKFVFGKKGKSYAAQTCPEDSNIGIIGTAVFFEKVAPPKFIIRNCSVDYDPDIRQRSVCDSLGVQGQTVCSTEVERGASYTASSSGDRGSRVIG